MTSKLTQLFIACVGIVLVAFNATASPQLSGTITELWVNDQGRSNVVFISVGTSFSSSCGATSVYLIIDLSEPSMKEAYAMALSASMAGRTVQMGGTGVCYQQWEKLKYIYITQ